MTDNRIWLFGTALATVVVLALGWFVGVSPKLDQANLALQSVDSVDAQNTAQEAQLVVLHDQFTHIATSKTTLDALRKSIPDSANLGDFYDFLQSTAIANGLAIVLVAADEAQPYGSATTGAATAPVPLTPSSKPSSTATPSPAASVESAPATQVAAATGGQSQEYTIKVSITVGGQSAQFIAFTKAVQLGQRFFLSSKATWSSSGLQGILTGYVFVVPSPNIPLFQKPKAAATPTPTPTPSPTGSPTATPTGSPTATSPGSPTPTPTN